MDKLRSRFQIEAVLAITSSALGILTATVPDWVETLTGSSPDHGSGAFEWTLTGALAIVAIIAGALAGTDYRRRNAQRGGQS